MKSLVKKMIPESTWQRLKLLVKNPSIVDLCIMHRTDKWGVHKYAPHYDRHLCHLRTKPISLLEIGVGGYDNPNKGGASLKMWKSYFTQANIFAIDYYDKSPLQESRITIFKGSQNDPDFLKWVVSKIGDVHVIIDDGSHINEHVLTSFQTLFPLLHQDGIYAIEDMQTSYWEEFGGTEDTSANHTSVSLVKSLIDAINWEEFRDSEPDPIGKFITSISVYHNLAFIQKGNNVEGSNKDKKHEVVTEST